MNRKKLIISISVLVVIALVICIVVFTSKNRTDNNDDLKQSNIQDEIEALDKEDYISDKEDTDMVKDTGYQLDVIVGGEAVIPELHIEMKEIPDNDALRFTRAMKIGWNLGNTFDAIQDGGYAEDEMKLEYAWSGTKTTENMIKNVKHAGFNTLRLPVSWHNHLIDNEFTISSEWLERVQEIVDCALENDMYVILNMHHDIGYDYYYPTPDYLDSSKKYLEAIWRQLSEYFIDYDECLVFEGMNEPRMTDTQYEWWLDMSKEECRESIECINQMNQVFVDTVRTSEGNNSNRYLMVPGYAADPDKAADDTFRLPKDSADNKIIVSVHAYRPYHFALQGPDENDSVDTFSIDNPQSTREIDAFMDALYNKYIINGIPVIIGEFGARKKGDNLQARVDFSAYYIAAASARGMVGCWWDNNAFIGNGENFGLLYRNNNTWRFQDIILAMMKYTYNELAAE